MLICHLFRKCENKALLILIWHGMRGTYQERWMAHSYAIQDFQTISIHIFLTCPTLFKLISLKQNVNEIEPAQKKQLIISVIVMIVCI
jgi:hypothetical protein